MDILDRLLGHDAWTTRQLLLRCRGLTDEQLDQLAGILDDFIHIPGIPVRIGQDPIIGLIPGLGDVTGALLVGGITQTLDGGSVGLLEHGERIGISRWWRDARRAGFQAGGLP